MGPVRGGRALTGFTWGVLAFLYLPIVGMLVSSFNAAPMGVRWGGTSGKWYAALGADFVDHVTDRRSVPIFTALGKSVLVAVFVSIASVVVGTAGAWLLHRHKFRASRALATVLSLPLVVPDVILGVSLLILFRTLHVELGLTTVVLAHMTFCVPFVLAAVRARLAGLDPALEEAAIDLGATPFQAFAHVILPSLMPAVVSSALLCFALSMDELVVTYFTSGPSAQTLPVVMFGMAKVGASPSLNALATLLVAATAVIVVSMERFRKKEESADA